MIMPFELELSFDYIFQTLIINNNDVVSLQVRATLT